MQRSMRRFFLGFGLIVGGSCTLFYGWIASKIIVADRSVTLWSLADGALSFLDNYNDNSTATSNQTRQAQEIGRQKRKSVATKISLLSSATQQHQPCPEPYPESKYGQALLARFHMQAGGLSADNRQFLTDNHDGANLVVFAVRDPIDRLVSAYYYHQSQRDRHKKDKAQNIPVFQCYASSMDDLLRGLEQQHVQPHCNDLAVQLVTGHLQAKSLQHFYYNYQYYARMTWTDRARQNIAVIRTEHQWEDVARLETLLGGDGQYFLTDTVHYTHGSETYKKDTHKDENSNSHRSLCCVIHKELLVYHDLIVAAVNLYPDEKEDAIQSLQRKCGIQSPTTDNLFEWQAWKEKNCG
eukprot:scaffold4510_cov183-Amphora_coffeaeformis.AAC.105